MSIKTEKDDIFFKALRNLVAVASVSSCASTDYCWQGIALGFDSFSKEEFTCKSTQSEAMTCYSAKASNAKHWYAGKMCIAYSEIVWEPPRRNDKKHEFDVGRYKVSTKTEKNETNCFFAGSVSPSSSHSFYFCDLNKIGPENEFTAKEIEKLLAKKYHYK